MSVSNKLEQGFTEDLSKLSVWTQWAEVFNKEPAHECIKCDHNKYYLLYTNLTPAMHRAIDDYTESISDYKKRNETQNWLYFCVRIRGCQQTIMFMSQPKTDYPEELWPIWDSIRTGTIEHIKCADPVYFARREFGEFAIKTSSPLPAIKNLKLREKTLNSYITLLTSFFEKHYIIGSKEYLENILSTIGEREPKLLRSAKWLYSYIQSDDTFISKTRCSQLWLIICATNRFMETDIHTIPTSDSFETVARPIMGFLELQLHVPRHPALMTQKSQSHPDVEDQPSANRDDACPICQTNQAIVAGQCGHRLCCGCSTTLCEKGLASESKVSKCPICREKWIDQRRIY